MPEYTSNEKNVFQYLFDLQESGVTNMFGAKPYLRRAFPLMDSSNLEDLLMEWMKNYNNIRNDMFQYKNDSPTD